MKNQLVKMWLSSSLIGLLLVSALAMEIPIHVGATGNTYYIAASNSSSLDKAAANAVCTGTKDQNTINPYLTNGSTVILDNGTYNISGYVFLASNSHLLGTSNVGTVLNFSSSSVCIGDISNVEVGNFAVTGTMSSAVEIITSTANQSGFNIHDIKSTSTGNADADFEVYADNYTVSNIVFNNCDANNPNGYGFLLTGTGAGAIINGITLYNCSVENAGVASTRNSIWIAGYNLGENIVSLNNVALIHCTCNGAWESDFMFDNTVQSIKNAVFLDCNAQNAGQSSSAYYGSGILIPSTAVQAILNGNTGSGNKGGSYTKTHFDISVYNSPYIGYAFPKNLVLGSSQTVTRANQGNCIGIIVTDGNAFDLYLYSSDGNSVNQTLTLPNGNTYAASFSNYQVIRGVTGTLSITSVSLVNGQVGAAYSQTLTATGGTIPYTWSIVSGTLPVGLTISSEGVILGTPTITGGPTSITFKVTDSTGANATKSISIAIGNATWDVNKDGIVNALDMTSISLHWGETGTPGWIPQDVNSDGIVNSLDLIIVGQHWTP
jgi:hypothetical protein